MAVMVELQKLSKRFGAIQAVDNVSFTVKRGEVLGFLGPNGAGKSTTMKMVTGFLAPTSGTAKVCGHDVLSDSMASRRAIGYLPEGAPAYPDMTVKGYLEFIANVRKLRGTARKEALERAVGLLKLEGVMHQPIETLSKGFKRRVGLAQAILHDPEVLILDEPTDGLDPNQKHEVRTLIQQMAANKAIILSTHILEEVEAVCTRAIIIARGKVIFDGTPEKLEAKGRTHNAISLTVEKGQADRVRETLKGVDAIATIEEGAGTGNGTENLMIVPKDGQPILQLVSGMARESGWNVREMRQERGRLDEVFRGLTAAAPEKAASKKKGGA